MALHVAKVSHKFIRQIAYEYLEPFATMKKLAKKHKSSPGTISKILFKGVSENIVDDITAEAVANKAMNSTDNVVRTRKRWETALLLRSSPLSAAELKEELEYQRKKLEELNFQIESYDSYFFGESDAPSLTSLKSQRSKLLADIQKLNDMTKG